MVTLVIIGNGFDMWHGLPTGYRDFRDNHRESLEPYFQYFKAFNNTTRFWNNFERSLGTFKQDEFYQDIPSGPTASQLESSAEIYAHQDEVGEKVKDLIDAINSAFSSWIYSIETEKIGSVKRLIQFPELCKFVNFNYTSTLQKAYGIPNCDVLHIHGSVRGRIIFGHNYTSKQNAISYGSYTPWNDDAKDRVASVLDAFHKPVNDILDGAKPQLASYGDVKKIITIGHSLNAIDGPYFKFISATYPNAEWENYNIGDEIDKTHKRLIRLGVAKEKIKSDHTSTLREIYPLI